jgi:hypothetical protein
MADKEQYEKPTLTSEDVFEINSLVCGKCILPGPWAQDECLSAAKYS